MRPPLISTDIHTSLGLRPRSSAVRPRRLRDLLVRLRAPARTHPRARLVDLVRRQVAVDDAPAPHGVPRKERRELLRLVDAPGPHVRTPRREVAALRQVDRARDLADEPLRAVAVVAPPAR